MTTVFISHSTRDSDFAEGKLKPYLEGRGIKAWLSERDIPTAVDWERKIRRALSEAEWCIVILSPDAVKSDWVQAEVHWALEKRKGCVIPVMIRDCDPGELHLKLLRIQYIDLRTDPAAGARRLLEILQGSGLPARFGRGYCAGIFSYWPSVTLVEDALFSVLGGDPMHRFSFRPDRRRATAPLV
jgi:hypothetical protein